MTPPAGALDETERQRPFNLVGISQWKSGRIQPISPRSHARGSFVYLKGQWLQHGLLKIVEVGETAVLRKNEQFEPEILFGAFVLVLVAEGMTQFENVPRRDIKLLDQRERPVSKAAILGRGEGID